MARAPCASAMVVISGAVALAQGNMRTRLLPITSPPRHAGVYHVATGTWTRGADLGSVVGPDVIYNNSCMLVYFTGMLGGEKFQHRSRLPSPSGPTTDSIFYGTTDH